jgi:hypothetical protein
MRKIGIAVTVILIFVALIVLSLISRSCDTASKMADKTVFNANQHVWSYEEFYKKYNAYIEYQKQVEDAEVNIKILDSKGIIDGQERGNLVMTRDGSKQMMRRIAMDYNAMSQIAYQKVWKGKGLPEKLE